MILKNRHIVCLAILFILVLSACEKSPYKVAIDEGDHALSQNEFDKAINAYEKAASLKPDSEEAKKFVNNARLEKISGNIALGNDAYQKGNYKEASAFYDKVLEESALIEESQLLTIQTIRESSIRADNFINYLNWYTPIKERSSALLNEWETLYNNLTLGNIGNTELKQYATRAYTETAALTKEAQNHALDVGLELSSYHDQFRGILSSQHQDVKILLESTNAATTPLTSKQFSTLMTQAQAHIDFHRSLEQYAKSNEIPFDVSVKLEKVDQK